MLSFIKTISIFFKREWRNNYPSSWSLVSMPITELLTLALYWFTAKALSPKVEFSDAVGADYFQYIVIGEMALLIPASLLYNYTKVVKQMTISRGIDYLVVQPYAKWRFLLEAGMSLVLLRLGNILFTLFLLAVIFSTLLPLVPLLKMFLLIFSSLPAFIGLGFIAVSILVSTGRGERSVIMVSNAAYVLAGVYFPTQVFPENFERLINFISPFNTLLGSIRHSFLNPDQQNLFVDVALILGTGLILLLIGVVSVELAFSRFNRRKRPLILSG